MGESKNIQLIWENSIHLGAIYILAKSNELYSVPKISGIPKYSKYFL